MRTTLFLSIAFLALCQPLFAQPATAPSAHKLRIVLAGDSTVTDNAGWGKAFASLFSGDVEVINLSRGGRSSGSFVKEGRWKQAPDLKPDFVLVQFGHNDQPGHGPERETDPQTTYKANMLRYVEEGRAAGIQVVLVTPLSRRQWGDDGKIHSTLAPYAQAVREIAAEKKVPLIELHDWSIELYEKLGREGTTVISPIKATTQPTDAAVKPTYDGTHLNAKGAEMVAPIVADELAKVVPQLASYLMLSGKRITVSQAGDGDFRTIQEAIAAIPNNSKEPTIVHIKPGTYIGPFLLPKEKANVVLEGEDPATTILTYDRNVYETIPPGIDKFNPCLNIRANDFRASNLTIRNTSGDHGQALALRVDSDRVVFGNCRMLGWQDTVMVNNGRQYFRDCYIEGRVDFIYGSGTAVFEECEIHSKNGGYITAASTPKDRPFGFVFVRCKLTGDDVPWNPATTNPATTQKAARPNKLAYFGRPWRENAAVALMHCEIGDHIRPEGWHNWGKPNNELTARYREYKNTGPGAETSGRVAWAKQLTDEEAKDYAPENVLRGEDGWQAWNDQ